MDDSETAADGLDFTPPDTPSQHHQPGSPMDGAMGNSPSKDDAGAGAAGGSQEGGSQMSQPEDSGGILASLGPLTSPSNPTAGDAGGGVKDDAAVAAAAGAAADEGSDDDDEMTPSIDYNQDTEKFVPSAASNANEHDGDNTSNDDVEEEQDPAKIQGGECVSPLTMTEGQKDRSRGETDDHDEEEEEIEINSEDEAAIAQDGIYQPADGIAVGTIIGGGRGNDGASQSNRGGPTGGSDDDESDDEEFGSMEAPLADTGGLLTQGGGFGEDSDEEDDSSSSDFDGTSARAGEVGIDNDSDAEEHSQDLLGGDTGVNEGRTHEEQEESATEPPASAASDTEQTATAEDTVASVAEVEVEAMDVDTGMFVKGLTEQSESQTQPPLAACAADTEETGEDGIDNENADVHGGDVDGRGDDASEEEEEIVEGLTEQTETQTQPTVSANSQQEDAGSAAASSEVVPPLPSSATSLVAAEVVGLTEQSEWSQQDSQKAAAEESQNRDGAGSAKEPAAHGLDTPSTADDVAQTGAAVEAQSQKQHLSDAELMPPPASPHRRGPKTNRSAEVKADTSSQRSLASKLAEGSEDTYDSFGDLPVFSGDTEQMVMPSMDRFTANEDSPTKHGQFDEAVSESQVDAKMPPSEDAAPSPLGKTRSEQAQKHGTEEIEEGTGSSPSLGNLYENAETERFQGSPDNRAAQDDLRDEEVDTNASTPLVSHTQTYVEGRSSAASFSYPRVDELGPIEEKKVDSPSPVVPATPLQESHITGPKKSQNEVEDMDNMDIGASMRSVEEEIAKEAFGGGSESVAVPTTFHPEAATPANSKKNPSGGPITPAGAVLESEAATVMLSTTPASSKKMARDPASPVTATAAGTEAQASEATTVRLSTTPASTKKRPEGAAAGTSTPTKEIDAESPGNSDKPTTPASSERTTANSASSPNKSALSISSSPHSQPLLSPDAGVPPSSNLNSGSSSLLKSVEASNKAVAKHGQTDGKGLSQDDIVDSDEDTCEESGHTSMAVFPKNGAARSRDAAPDSTNEKMSTEADAGTKGELAQTKDSNKATPAGATNSSGGKRAPAAPAQWIHKHQKTNQKKHAVTEPRGEKGLSESEEEEEFKMEGGSEPTPRLFLPSNAKQRAAERKKELEIEADAFSSSDDDDMVARNFRAAAAAKGNKSNFALKDTQESDSSESEDESEEEAETGGKAKTSFASSSARTSSAKKGLKKRLRRDRSLDGESSPPSSPSSREMKRKLKRQSPAAYQVQDSLAMLGADASKNESSDEEEENEFEVDEISDDVSVSSSDDNMMPSQNTIDIDNLIGQAKGALQKFSDRNNDSQIAKLKRKVERLEKKCSKLKEGYNKVRVENAVLRRSLEKKITQNQEMKALLSKFNKMAQSGTLQAMDDDKHDAASESDNSIDSQTAPPPAKKKARRSTSASKKSSSSKRQTNQACAPLAASATTAPVVVPPSSIKARGRSQTKTALATVSSSSTCGKKRKNKQNKSRPTRNNESSDDENTTLADLTPKAKKLNFERHTAPVRTSNATNGRSRSRRGASTRDLIPKGLEHIRPSDIWNYLRDTHGWTWRQGPEPYNNVYVRPGIEHLNIVGINQDFYEDANYLYAEAKKAGFVVTEMAEEEEVGETGSQVDDDGNGADDTSGDLPAEEASVQSEKRGRRRGGYAQKQVNAATSPNGVHVSLSVGDYAGNEQDGEDNEEEEEEEEEQVESAFEEEDFDAESSAESTAEEDDDEEAEMEEEESEEDDDDDDIIATLDDTDLCGDARILTPRSAHVCAKLIRKFAKLRKDDASFMVLLWEPMWGMLKEDQGGEDKEDLKWGWAKSKGQLAQRSYWYVAPQSKAADGKLGVDYFEAEETVVLKVLQEIQKINPSLLEPCFEQVRAFETVLKRAVENNVAFSESRSNPDIGGGRRNRRKTTSDSSPFVYSARQKKARPSPIKARAETKKKGTAAAKTKKKGKAATSTSPKSKPKPRLTSSLKMSPSPRKATKSVAFSEPPPLSQNTMEGVETLLMMNAGADSTSDPPNVQAAAAAAATPDEGNDTTRASNPTTPDYEDIVTPKGIEALRAARLRSLQDVTPSPKKRAASSPASGAKSARASASAASSGRKRRKTRSPTKEEAPSSIDTRLSQVPYQLCDSLNDMSQSQSDATSTFARRKSTKRANDGRMLPLSGLSFFGSGLDDKHADIIKTLGGEYLSDVSSLDDATIYGSLFFVSNVQQRRKLKYILASALGVPMLHYSWLKAIQTKYEAIEERDDDSKADAIKILPYDSELFKAMRLPVGLSIKSGLYHLQKARHAKRWCRPGQENGKLVFKGLKLAVALENNKFESQWEDVLRAAGATIVKSSTLKSGKKCHLDALLVDRNSLPPHSTAVPSSISRCMNFVKNGNAKTTAGIAKIPIIDLSWALQCIVERERLPWDTDERYILYSDASSSNESGDKMYEMKVKVDNIPVRFECGDIVEFGRTKSTERIGRIISIEGSKRTCATRNLEIQLLDRNGNFELVDGGESATRVKINENELRRHITLLGAKDFKDIQKHGYLPATEKDTHIFVQKKPPSATSK